MCWKQEWASGINNLTRAMVLINMVEMIELNEEQSKQVREGICLCGKQHMVPGPRVPGTVNAMCPDCNREYCITLPPWPVSILRKEPVKISECEKLKAIQNESQIIGEFLEWLGEEKGYFICCYSKHAEFPDKPYLISETNERLLAKFFGIDLDKVEQEKRALLEDLRSKG